jgi:hypothetical protein
MNRIRFRVAILACWLVLFYNAERLLEPIYISDITYTLVVAVALITLVAPRLTRIPVWAVVTVPVLIFLALKVWTGAHVWGTAIPLSVTEMCAIALTTVLARRVGAALNEFESAVAHITIGRRDKVPEPASAGYGSIYREVRRARSYERPLALMAVAVEEKSIQVALDRMIQEAQLSMMKQYTLSSVSKTLCDELEDCNIVVQSNDHFLIVLPETTPEEVPGLVERLRQLVSDQIGVDLKIGAASLPQDSFTFEGLVDKATKEMEADLAARPSVDLGRLSVEHPA